MKAPLIRAAVLTLVFVCTHAFAANKEFPGRDIYLGTPYIEMNEFNAEFDNVIVVDVRSQYEYETLQILGAKNIALNSSAFTSKMEELRNANKDKKIIVYCNGKSCMKSYKAAGKAAARGIENVIAFDAGIMDWAKAYPEKTVLLGQTPIDPAQLISKERFTAHLLEPDKFAEMVALPGSNVLDVRDRLQRSGMGLFVSKENHAGLDNNEMLKQYIQKAVTDNKTLLIYDESGKQVRWLMYRLEARGLKNYYFMKGGTRAYFKHLRANK
ncbi:MAG: rhodanese-like domain-containing protein [Gammaproteobacteria bacterium]|nr:rhodanese-like domain-containing protein [Gammaproteobacteria bacterium]